MRENLLKLLAEHGEEECFTLSTQSDTTDDGVTSPSSAGDTSFGFQDNMYTNDRVVEGEITLIEPEDETNTDLIDIDVIDEEYVEISNKT